MHLTQGLQRSLQRHPDKAALCHVAADATRRWTFVQMLDEVARRAAALHGWGIRAGDRVALVSPNDDSLVINLLACWWMGAVACPLNLRWSVPELDHALTDCGAALLLADADCTPAVADITAPVTVMDNPQLAARAAGLPPMQDCRTGGDALAAILYTGGTTGRSKGVMLTHANFWTACMTRGAELNNSPDSVSLLVAPLFHVAGLGRLIGQSIVGGTCVTLPQFRPDAVLDAIENLGISDIIVVPTMLQALLDAPGFSPARVQSLDRIAFGAAPMPADLLERALATWPKAEFFQAYGMTETAGAVCIDIPSRRRGSAETMGTVGRAGLGSEIRIVDVAGVECPRGESGEIVVRGPMVTQGYWNLPGVSAQALRDGWLHTGDGGRMDAGGYLYLTDRLKDMIISGGENVYSAEVENALRGHPAVSEAAVIGVPHERWGEAVHAVVVVRRDGSQAEDTDALADQLTAWCRTRLAGYKCPRSFHFTDTLPLSAAGKVLKTTLRAAHRSPTPAPTATSP